tara:strand:+ start:2165 stop:4771 length:2607 start_codon:yes stop_codon:yes gene_type:complete
MTEMNSQSLLAGEIKIDYLCQDWPLTPLGENKNPYIQGWQQKPFDINQIKKELENGRCKAIGLIGGPAYNNPYGFVWVDIDGQSVYNLVEEISSKPFKKALPKTLTICSGKPGRERKLYKVPKELWKHFARNKYVWHSETEGDKLEILWKRHQGVLMGLHPETNGYYTKENEGYEFSTSLPNVPEWLMKGIAKKNMKQGVPQEHATRIVGPTFAINSLMSKDREIKEAIDAMWSYPAEVADNYEAWLMMGQCLHSVDESLLEEWDKWSQQSDKYKDGDCHRRWLSFSKEGGRGIGTIFHGAKEHGWTPSQDHKHNAPDMEMIDLVETMSKECNETSLAGARVESFTSPTGANAAQQATVNSLFQVPQKTEDKKGRNASADVVSDQLLQMYKGDLRFSITHDQFFMYAHKAPGLWSILTETEAKADIKNKIEIIKKDLLPRGYGINLLNDIFSQLKLSLSSTDWYDSNDMLLFKNGVLKVDTKELLPFSRDYYMTQQLPYNYEANAKCYEIINWFKHIQRNDDDRVQVLRAWLRATLLGRYDIQKFVEIVGPGKSGKSTYANLAVALVGKDNTYSTDFKNLEESRFEASAFRDKKLILFQDADRWGGSVSKLKAITGGDWIRSERKYQKESMPPFQYHGLVMITANEAIQSTDYTTGLSRRRLTIPFDRPFEGGPSEQKELIKFNRQGEPGGIFADMLPGLVNWLLDMSEQEMREYLMSTEKKAPFFAQFNSEQILNSNPMLDWMENNLIYAPGTVSLIGKRVKTPPGTSEIYAESRKYLYPNYCEFCLQSNYKEISRSRFTYLLKQLFYHELKLNIYTQKDTRTERFFNVCTRTNPDGKDYTAYPSLVAVSKTPEKYYDFYGNIQIKR